MLVIFCFLVLLGLIAGAAAILAFIFFALGELPEGDELQDES